MEREESVLQRKYGIAESDVLLDRLLKGTTLHHLHLNEDVWNASGIGPNFS